MAVLPIRIYGDPILRMKAEEVRTFDDNLAALAEDLIETMHVASGIGLAAPQVGVSLSLCVVDVGLIEEGQPPQVFVNPEIIEKFGEKISMEEGCLSIPGINENVPRDEGIHVRYQNLQGENHELRCTQMLARVLQHEIDHLNGIFFIDRLSGVTRKLLAKKLRALAAESHPSVKGRKLQSA